MLCFYHVWFDDQAPEDLKQRVEQLGTQMDILFIETGMGKSKASQAIQDLSLQLPKYRVMLFFCNGSMSEGFRTQLGKHMIITSFSC